MTTPRKVTRADIEAAICREDYFTAAKGILGAAFSNAGDDATAEEAEAFALNEVMNAPAAHARMTFCILTLKNGFAVSGSSACADASVFDAATGQTLAREDAIEKMWPLLGYALRTELMAEGKA